MANQIFYLQLDQIIVIHDIQVKRHGGSPGIRDNALLESALYRPQASYGGADLYPTIFDKAAVLMHSVILNHPFIDGNKRTGMFSGILFLERNGVKLNLTSEKVETAALNIANKKWDVAEISTWLEQNTKPL